MQRKVHPCLICGRETVGKLCGYCHRAGARSRLKNWKPHIPENVDAILETFDRLRLKNG
jgi:hypothetical protein